MSPSRTESASIVIASSETAPITFETSCVNYCRTHLCFDKFIHTTIWEIACDHFGERDLGQNLGFCHGEVGQRVEEGD
jgi:hypothetical protein